MEYIVVIVKSKKRKLVNLIYFYFVFFRAKRFPIRLENKVSAIYKESKTLYIYLETSWEKESWCRALRLGSCDDKSTLERFVKLQKQFRSYLTSLNAGYPSFMKPSAGFYAADSVDRAPKIEGSSSKVRTLWKKLAKRASKGGVENKSTWISSSVHGERKISEKFHPYQDLVQGISLSKIAPPADAFKDSMGDTSSTSSTLTHSGSQSQISGVSDADFDERFCIDEGTLCWNLLISRLFFDAKGNAEMKRSLQARIQVCCFQHSIFLSDDRCVCIYFIDAVRNGLQCLGLHCQSAGLELSAI